MYVTENWAFMVLGFTAGFFSTWLGLLLIGKKVQIPKLVLVGTGYVAMAILLRWLPIDFRGLQFFVLVGFLLVVNKFTWKLSFQRAAIATIIGMSVLAIGEGLFFPVLSRILHWTTEDIVRYPLRSIIMALPQIAFIALLIIAFTKYPLGLWNRRTE